MQNVKKKFLKEIKKSKKISWQNPLKIAQKISQNYQKNCQDFKPFGIYSPKRRNVKVGKRNGTIHTNNDVGLQRIGHCTRC